MFKRLNERIPNPKLIADKAIDKSCQK